MCFDIPKGLFKEKSASLQRSLPDFHMDILQEFAAKLNLPLFLSGDTKFLRSILNIGSAGHLKCKKISLRNWFVFIFISKCSLDPCPLCLIHRKVEKGRTKGCLTCVKQRELYTGEHPLRGIQSWPTQFGSLNKDLTQILSNKKIIDFVTPGK